MSTAQPLSYNSPESAYLHNPTPSADSAMRALLSSTWQVMEQVQRPPPSMNDILGAYKAKGDGDREMLLALLNAKTAEENRVAAVTALHRTLLDLYNGTGMPQAESATHTRSETRCVFPSPPSSSYHQSPLVDTSAPRPRRRKSSSPSAYSSEDSLSSQPRKRHRSRSPLPRERHSRASYDTLSVPPLDASFPPSPYSSASSQSSVGSPRSRESMTIGALLTPAHEKDVDMDDRRLSDERTISASSPYMRRERENSIGHRA